MILPGDHTESQQLPHLQQITTHPQDTCGTHSTPVALTLQCTSTELHSIPQSTFTAHHSMLTAYPQYTYHMPAVYGQTRLCQILPCPCCFLTAYPTYCAHIMPTVHNTSFSLSSAPTGHHIHRTPSVAHPKDPSFITGLHVRLLQHPSTPQTPVWHLLRLMLPTGHSTLPMAHPTGSRRGACLCPWRRRILGSSCSKNLPAFAVLTLAEHEILLREEFMIDV